MDLLFNVVLVFLLMFLLGREEEGEETFLPLMLAPSLVGAAFFAFLREFSTAIPGAFLVFLVQAGVIALVVGWWFQWGRRHTAWVAGGFLAVKLGFTCLFPGWLEWAPGVGWGIP